MMLKWVRCLCSTFLIEQKTLNHPELFSKSKVYLFSQHFCFVQKYAPFKQCICIRDAINQISTMLLMGSPAAISLNRHGQQHSWELICTPIYSLHNKYMQEILSKKMEYLISYLSGLPNPMLKFPRLFMMRVASCTTSTAARQGWITFASSVCVNKPTLKILLYLSLIAIFVGMKQVWLTL